MIALDAFGDQDMKALAESYSLRRDFDIRYSPGALCRASLNFSFDAVAYTSNLENHPGIVRRIAGSRPVIGNSPEVISAARCWDTLFPRLKQAGFSVPETIFAGDSRKADTRRRWLVKPVLSGGGHGVSFAQHGQIAGGHFLLQEHLQGKSCSASFIANGRDCVLIGVAEQLTGMRQFGSQGFRYCGNLLPLPEAFAPETGKDILEQVRRLSGFLTREYGLRGANGMDFILSGNKVCLTEVNPRYSASMELIEQAYELPVFDLHVRAALDGTLPGFKLEALLSDRKFFGKAILFAERDTVAPDTRNWLNGSVHDIPASGENLHKGSPVCTILFSRPTHDETLAELISRAGMLKKEIYASN